MHHEGLVESGMIYKIATISHMDERGLRERGQKLMR